MCFFWWIERTYEWVCDICLIQFAVLFNLVTFGTLILFVPCDGCQTKMIALMWFEVEESNGYGSKKLPFDCVSVLLCRLRSKSRYCHQKLYPFTRNMRYLKSRALPSHVHIHSYDSMNDTLEVLIKKSISFRDVVKSKQRSISFDGRDSEAAILQAFGPGNLLIKGSVSFNGRFMETKASVKSPKPTNSANPRSFRCSPLKKRSLESTLVGPDSPKHDAALKLQKVYRSFRTRRQLADCAVLVEQRWYELLPFINLDLGI